MPDSFDPLRHELHRLRQHVDGVEFGLHKQLDELSRKIEVMAAAQAKVNVALQGDKEWQRKGILDQLVELAAFVETTKSFNLAEMKDFMVETKDLKKKVLTISGFLVSVTGIVWLIILNLSKIQDAFH